MSNNFSSEDSIKVAQAIVAAARQAAYLPEGEAMQSSPELAALEKPIFIKMYQAFKAHLQDNNAMELTADEISSMFNFAVGKGAELA